MFEFNSSLQPRVMRGEDQHSYELIRFPSGSFTDGCHRYVIYKNDGCVPEKDAPLDVLKHFKVTLLHPVILNTKS